MNGVLSHVFLFPDRQVCVCVLVEMCFAALFQHTTCKYAPECNPLCDMDYF